MALPPFVEAKAEAVAALCRRCHVIRLDLFGSAATGKFDPKHSDLDFLVTLERLPPWAYTDAYDQLQAGLTAIFGREVDLVSEKGIVNPYFAESVNATRSLVYAAT